MQIHPNRLPTLLSTLLACSLLAAPFFVQAETAYSKKYERCMDAVDLGAMKNSQWAACADSELKVVDSELNANYKKLQANLNEEQRTALLKSQRAWIKYRDERCKFESIGPSAPAGAAGQSMCMLEMTAEKARYLKLMQ